MYSIKSLNNKNGNNSFYYISMVFSKLAYASLFDVVLYLKNPISVRKEVFHILRKHSKRIHQLFQNVLNSICQVTY